MGENGNWKIITFTVAWMVVGWLVEWTFCYILELSVGISFISLSFYCSLAVLDVYKHCLSTFVGSFGVGDFFISIHVSNSILLQIGPIHLFFVR